MNYRHAFHAGNFADVLKHTVLTLALKRLMQKPKPLRVIDTHAGIASYRLDGPEAQRTGEWMGGIGRLIGPEAAALPPVASTLLAPYLDAVRALNPDGQLCTYPGSPSLALALMRPDDRLIASELHPEDVALLREALHGDRRAKVLAMDGWQAVRALLPPKERRGLILIDPPFEAAGEMDRLVQGLTDGLRRFATGTFMLWLPVKDEPAIARFETALRALALRNALWIGLQIASPRSDGPLTATALVMVNAPYGLSEELAELLPFFAERLAAGPGARWSLHDL